MTLHRAYVSAQLLNQATPNSIVELPEDVMHRLTTVLRLTPKTEVELFDGKGVTVRGHLISPSKPDFLIEAVVHKQAMGPTLILAQAMVKQDKLEDIVQHGTELGIHQFVFFAAERSIVKVTERTQSHVERLQRIAIDASRQCERSDVPDLLGPLSFPELILQLKGKSEKEILSDPLILVGEPRSEAGLFDVMSELDLSKIHEIVLVIGPEGGLSNFEIEALVQIGAKAVRYAPHVLRTQTAGLVGMSIIQSFAL